MAEESADWSSETRETFQGQFKRIPNRVLNEMPAKEKGSVWTVEHDPAYQEGLVRTFQDGNEAERREEFVVCASYLGQAHGALSGLRHCWQGVWKASSWSRLTNC
jgi:hypothetical protein